MRKGRALDMKIMLLMVIALACLSIYQSVVIYDYQYFFSKLIWAMDTLDKDWQAEHWGLLKCKKGIPL